MKVSRSLLVRFSLDECTKEEELAIRDWLHNGSWPLLPEGEKIPDDIREKVWNKLQDRMQAQSGRPAGIRKKRRHLLGAAALLLVLMGTATLVYYNRYSGTQRQVTYITGVNEHRKVVLPDSSVVFMSPNSMITAIQPFLKDEREIQLRGQAVFEVAQDASRPFTVIAGDIRTTALGTSFKVTSFPDKNDISVVLSYGKVVVKDYAVQGHVKSFFLDPGDEIVYNKAARTMHKTESVGEQFDYRKDVLYFRNAGIKEVVEKLERYYHIKVKYQALKQVDWSISGEFDYQPLKVVMKAIAYSCNISYEMKDKTLILMPYRLSQQDK